MGGLSKKAFQIKELTHHNNKKSVVLDSGNLLFKAPALPPQQEATARLTAETIIKATSLLGDYTVAVGSRDLAAGLSFLQEQATTKNITWLSLNIQDNITQQPLFSPYTVIEAAGISVAILGLTDHVPFQNKQTQFVVRPWHEPLAAALRTAGQKADLIILLSSYRYAINEQIAQTHDNIHIILQSGHATTNLAPKLINNTLICQTASRGKYLGVLNIDWKAGSHWGKGESKKLDQLEKKLTRIEKQISREEQQGKLAQTENEGRYQRLVDAKEGLLQQKKKILDSLNQNTRPIATFSHQFIPLKPNLPDHPEVAAMIMAAKKEMIKLRRKRTMDQ